MKNFFANLWRKHKVKTLGILAMLFGFSQANFETIRDLIPERWRGATLFIFGMLATIFGFLSRNSDDPPPPSA